MSRAAAPDIAVIFVTSEADATLFVAKLRAQTIQSAIEVIVVAPESSDVTLDDKISAGFYSVGVARCGDEALWGDALATGVRHATAPVVALIEDHCFPEPGWAEALVRRHAEGYAVVGSEISNANPESSLSWCSFLLTHGAWSRPARSGVVDTVAGDNTSYRRDVLLGVGEEMGTLLASGTILHWQLREVGEQVFLESEAKAAHVTPSRLRSYVGSRFHSGRTFAGLWARRWPWRRRLYFAAMSPLIALRRVFRVMQMARRQPTRLNLVKLAPLLALAVPFSGLRRRLPIRSWPLGRIHLGPLLPPRPAPAPGGPGAGPVAPRVNGAPALKRIRLSRPPL